MDELSYLLERLYFNNHRHPTTPSPASLRPPPPPPPPPPTHTHTHTHTHHTHIQKNQNLYISQVNSRYLQRISIPCYGNRAICFPNIGKRHRLNRWDVIHYEITKLIFQGRKNDSWNWNLIMMETRQVLESCKMSSTLTWTGLLEKVEAYLCPAVVSTCRVTS